MKQILLIIDAQQELIEGNQEQVAVFKKEQLITNINLVIEKASEFNVPIVFVRDLSVAEGKGKGFQVHEKIAVPKDTTFFDKTAMNSFHGTGLLNYLKSQAIEHIIVMGCATQYCIDSAVRTATINGLDVTLVENGHSTIGSAVLSAEQIIKHHNETLHRHDNVENFSIVRNAEEDLFYPTHNIYR
ncbi:isochorismatase family protein [Virgibacillus sp. JSM 102003]|uniref:isochorismatase family protein n=1 Tax=Virgibacillus sp. JSM 102003 TaxID=1562108 RepID=UPI0035C16D48